MDRSVDIFKDSFFEDLTSLVIFEFTDLLFQDLYLIINCIKFYHKDINIKNSK